MAVCIGVPGATAANTKVSPRVREMIAAEGSARVLVRLRLPAGEHVAEAWLPVAGSIAQRADIAAAASQVLARLGKARHRVLHRYQSIPVVALEIDAAGLAQLEASSFWAHEIIEDTVNEPALLESVPLIGAPTAWARGFDGSGMTVAIVDTGVDANHPFLAGKVVEEACFSSTVAGRSESVCPNGSNSQVGPGSARPCSIGGCGHGTHVAGIAAGKGGTFSGVAKGSAIMAVQVFSRFTSASTCGGSSSCLMAWTSDIIAGLERVYAVRGLRNIASVNVSLGGGLYSSPCDSEPEKAIIDNLRAAGIATVVAAGNGGSATSLSSPACISSAVSVGSTTKADAISSFSNVAPFLSLFAPGEPILSSIPGGFGVASGTSMAAPHVTGAWAVLKQAAPVATVDEILGLLQSTGRPLTDARTGITKARIRVDQSLAALGGVAVAAVTAVTAVTPNQGTAGASVAVTIDGTGFVSGATVGAGAGITVSSVALVSATRLTATFTVAGGAAAGARDVTVTNPGGSGGMLANGFTVTASSAPTVTLAYQGKLRDRVGAGDTARAPDGAADGTLTLTVNGVGGRMLTRLRLQNDIGGVWNTTAGNGSWLLGVATGLDGALVNDAATMAVNVAVPEGGSLMLFGSDYAGGQGFAAGRTLTVKATFSDGSTAQGVAAVPAATAVAVTAVTPNQGAAGASVAVTVDGTGFGSGATVGAGPGITVSSVAVVSATRLTATFAIGGGAAAGARNVTVTNPGGSGGTLASGFTVTASSAATVTAAYRGKLRDRVGAGDTARAPDGAADGTLALTVNGAGGRTVTRLRLQNDVGGVWDTTAGNGFWLLGVATGLDGALVNDAATMAVNVAVPEGGSLMLFGSDYAGGQGFAAGRALTVKVTFSDGSTAQAVAAVAAASTTVTLAYQGKLRDRIGAGDTARAPDGAADGTLTLTVNGAGGRTISRLRLQNDIGGVWDTVSGNGFWLLGVAGTLDGALVNDAATMGATVPVADGGRLVLFASDYAGGAGFRSGRTLTVSATFSDGTTGVGGVIVP